MSTHKRAATDRRNSRNPRKGGQSAAFFGGKGTMGKREKAILSIIAGQAFDLQRSLGNLDDTETRDSFRRAQVLDVTGKPGLRECVHDDFRPLLSRFQLLAGQDEKALATAMRTGRITTKGAPGDTREAREKIVHEIRQRLDAHIELADHEWAQLLEIWSNRGKAAWAQIYAVDGKVIPNIDPWPGLDPKWVNKAMNRKIALADNGGPVRHGYIVTLARHKTRRPDLTLGPDLWAGLAERCNIKQLADLLATLVNRINAKEGIEDRGRNASQKSTAAKQRRSKKTLAPDPAPPVPSPETQRASDLFSFLQKPRT